MEKIDIEKYEKKRYVWEWENWEYITKYQKKGTLHETARCIRECQSVEKFLLNVKNSLMDYKEFMGIITAEVRKSDIREDYEYEIHYRNGKIIISGKDKDYIREKIDKEGIFGLLRDFIEKINRVKEKYEADIREAEEKGYIMKESD